jgi:Domain of unknown function (DUF4123)
MSYFACDDCDALPLVDELTYKLTRGVGGKHWMALVDMAFDHGRLQLAWRGESALLYQAGRLGAMSAVSPRLCRLSINDHLALERELIALVRHASGRPMLSFLKSSLNATELAMRFQDVLEVKTSDRQPFVLRLADTRALPAMASTFTSEHWALVARQLDCWAIVNRHGALEDLTLAARVDDGPQSKESISLSDAELAGLLTKGQPDALIQALFENFPDLLPIQGRARVHDLMARVCAFGAAHGVTSFPELAAMAVAAASTEGKLLDHPRLPDWLDAGAWQQGQFEEGLVEFMETAE